MAKANEKRYGLFISAVGIGDGTRTVRSFFEEMNTAYPQSEGWEVVERHVTPQSDSRYLVVYHLEAAG